MQGSCGGAKTRRVLIARLRSGFVLTMVVVAYRPRKDVGRQCPGRLAGTFKRVKVQHKVAVRRLLEAAERDQNDPASMSRRQTVCGFRRRAIDLSEAQAPKPGKSMLNFLKTTRAIKEARAKCRVWTG